MMARPESGTLKRRPSASPPPTKGSEREGMEGKPLDESPSDPRVRTGHSESDEVMAS